eukprot:TRINITY_DN67744_c0_g1_i1.p1 TRINITY_DN67744_c0_g1~~TRINITY_DN67744_c0_g1_i1.p1  ORF type:complete len:482 (+),score=70.81 TRINITY_DN67744_c0_g1_i1:214-1446(+)
MAAADWPWPEHVVCHPQKQPRFIHSVEELIFEMQRGCHMDEIVVFPDGLRALGQQRVLDPRMAAATGLWSEDSAQLDESPPARNAYEVLERLDADGYLADLKGKVSFFRQAQSRRDSPADTWQNTCLAPKWQALKGKCLEEDKPSMYISEMRRLEPQPTPGDNLRSKRKSTLITTLRERMHKLGMDVKAMLYWDDYSEGCFCGAGSSGYNMHADCIPTSNAGSVFAGHKLLAIWKYPDDTREILRMHGRELFVKPLPERQIRALESACCVGLAPPGSIYVFSGSNAHAVCNVGFSAPGADGSCPVPSLIVSSYEAFLGLHPRHAAVAIDTCKENSDDSDLEDFEDEITDAALELQHRLNSACIKESDAAQVAVDLLRANLPRTERALRRKFRIDGEIEVDDSLSEKRMRR